MNTFAPVKPVTTYADQINILKGRGLILNDQECLEFLKRVNYYKLTAYLLPFRNIEGKYLPGTTFSQIKGIYDFEGELRQEIYGIIGQIEISLKAKFAYYFAHTYGPLGYLDSNNYSPRHNAVKFQEQINKCIAEQHQTPVVQHHNNKYGGKFPIWVIIEFFSIGMLSRFYSDMKMADKKAIARTYFNTTPNNLSSWLRCFTDLRNMCAHYSRLYYWIFTAIPLFHQPPANVNLRSLFSQILVLKYLYPTDDWECFRQKLSNMVTKYQSSIDLNHIGFPANWYDLLG
ncbi:MAG: Abi family protein [Sphaerochaetaceae bacterium]|nr:Abi family protein [Sphaerochaetaceae bacterium]